MVLVIRGFFADEAALGGLRAAYGAMRPRLLVVPDAVVAWQALGWQTLLEEDGLERVDLADRGRYDVNRRVRDDEMFEVLRRAASFIVGEPLALAGARWLRYRRGDYTLYKGDDARDEPHPHHELTLDFSSPPLPADAGGGIVYGDGRGTALELPALAGSLLLVERAPGTLRFDRYLTHRAVDAAVWRLRLTLRPAGPGGDS